MFSLPRSTDNAETNDAESQSDKAHLESDRSLNVDLDQDSDATDESGYTQLKIYENLQEAMKKDTEDVGKVFLEKAREVVKRAIRGELERKAEEEANNAKEEIDKPEKKTEAAAIEEMIKKDEGAKRAELSPIRFKDAVGRKFSLPFHLCNTWQVCPRL
jgi:hypothetical protein